MDESSLGALFLTACTGLQNQVTSLRVDAKNRSLISPWALSHARKWLSFPAARPEIHSCKKTIKKVH